MVLIFLFYLVLFGEGHVVGVVGRVLQVVALQHQMTKWVYIYQIIKKNLAIQESLIVSQYLKDELFEVELKQQSFSSYHCYRPYIMM